MGTEEAPETEYEPGEIYEDARGFRYLRVLTDSMPRLPVSGSPLPWLYLDRTGDAVGRLEGIPQRPLRKMVPEGAAEGKLAAVRAYRVVVDEDGEIQLFGPCVETIGCLWHRTYDQIDGATLGEMADAALEHEGEQGERAHAHVAEIAAEMDAAAREHAAKGDDRA